MTGASGATGFGTAICMHHQCEGNATRVWMGGNCLKKVQLMNKLRKLSHQNQSVKSQLSGSLLMTVTNSHVRICNRTTVSALFHDQVIAKHHWQDAFVMWRRRSLTCVQKCTPLNDSCLVCNADWANVSWTSRSLRDNRLTKRSQPCHAVSRSKPRRQMTKWSSPSKIHRKRVPVATNARLMSSVIMRFSVPSTQKPLGRLVFLLVPDLLLPAVRNGIHCERDGCILCTH